MSTARTLLKLGRGKFGAILADPPWPFESYSGAVVPTSARGERQPYKTMAMADIAALPVGELAAKNCALFLWVTWPTLPAALDVIRAWGFTFKTCGFCWVKGDELPLFPGDITATMGMGYWTRSNSEVCLLATRGRPKRLQSDVRQVIIERRREHSRKPEASRERIEQLVAGPYLELFARHRRPGWKAWGNETRKFGGRA